MSNIYSNHLWDACTVEIQVKNYVDCKSLNASLLGVFDQLFFIFNTEFGFWDFLIEVILLCMRGRNLMKNSSKKSFTKLPINKVFATFLLN